MGQYCSPKPWQQGLITILPVRGVEEATLLSKLLDIDAKVNPL